MRAKPSMSVAVLRLNGRLRNSQKLQLIGLSATHGRGFIFSKVPPRADNPTYRSLDPPGRDLFLRGDADACPNSIAR